MARVATGFQPDGLDTYTIPEYAIAGCSDTGPGGPAPTIEVIPELTRFSNDLKRDTGIPCAMFFAHPRRPSVIYKRWLVVAKPDWERASEYADDWLREHRQDTRFIHDANGDEVKDCSARR